MRAQMTWEEACDASSVAEAAITRAEEERASVALEIAYALVTYGRVRPELRRQFEQVIRLHTAATAVHREASLRIDRILADRADAQKVAAGLRREQSRRAA